MSKKKLDKFEDERWQALGRGYAYMTDAEVGKDLLRRFPKLKKDLKDISKEDDK